MKIKNTMGFIALVHSITTATRERRNRNSEQSMRPLSISTSITIGYRPHLSLPPSLWLAFITHTHPSLNHTFNHQLISLLHAAELRSNSSYYKQFIRENKRLGTEDQRIKAPKGIPMNKEIQKTNQPANTGTVNSLGCKLYWI